MPKIRITTSVAVSRIRPASRPSGMPTPSATMNAAMVRDSVAPPFCFTTDRIDWLSVKLLPKSRCKIDQR